MTYIPDCRTDEHYNEKYLNKQDKEFIAGAEEYDEIKAEVDAE